MCSACRPSRSLRRACCALARRVLTRMRCRKGCGGSAPKGRHPRLPAPGDRVIVIGGRTGRDGLRGATFSSQTMDAQTGEVAGASVQIGNPITEKGLIEVIVRARDQRLYHAITDCGAGGLSSAVGEMSGATGAVVE